MALLNPSSFKTTSPLEDFSIKYANDLDSFAALKIFAPQIVSKSTGKFYSYSKDNLKVRDLTAPSGTEAKSGVYSVSTRTFTCLEKAYKHLVLERDARDFDRPVADLDQEAAAQNMEALMLELESAMWTKISTTTNYPSALVNSLTDGTNDWDSAAGDPMNDIRVLKQEVYEYCLKFPNALALSKQGLEILKLNASIVDRVKYTGMSITEDILKTLFDLQEIIVSSAGKNTANDGAADALSMIWEDDALLFYKKPNPGLKDMCYGKAFIVNQLYTKTIDKPELGRGMGAHEVETGWEYSLDFVATVSSSDGDAVAGGLIANIF